jgi:hypothetical protein
LREHAGGRRSARPRLEFLEPRNLLSSSWTVTDNSDSPTDTRSLRYAIQNAPDGATIEFSPSVINPVLLTNGTLNITRNLEIEGAGSLMIDGNNASTVFSVSSGVTATITGLTIAYGKGGGIYNDGTLTLANCAVEFNQVSSGLGGAGGGIEDVGTLTMNNCSVQDNECAGGTGGGIEDLGTLTLTGCTVSNNSAAFGGGINTDLAGSAPHANDFSAEVTLTNCTISGNSASGSGGGIDAYGVLRMTGCTVSGNSASGTGAGGIDTSQGTATITNSTIVDNSAPSQYSTGGIRKGNTKLTLTNCTVADNLGGRVGGIESPGPCILANTIIAGNVLTSSDGSAPDVGGSVDSLGHNLIGNPSGSSGWASTDLQNRNPLLSILGNYGGPTQTMALLPGSPAIGTASASISGVTLPTTDQRGDPRTTSGAVDIGAFQSRGFRITLTSGSNQSATVNTAFAAPLVVLVTSAHGEPVDGGFVSFAAPASGASSRFSGGIRTASINGSGLASINLSANATAGGPYLVKATARGISNAVNFSLTNKAKAADARAASRDTTISIRPRVVDHDAMLATRRSHYGVLWAVRH